jgi:hypothetical protein
MGNFLPGGSYLKSARNIRVTLYCEARTSDGQWVPASLDLTHLEEAKVMNENGVLLNVVGNVPTKGFLPGGPYLESTRSWSVILSALCKTNLKSWQWSALDITNFFDSATLSNVNGVLCPDTNSTN